MGPPIRWALIILAFYLVPAAAFGDGGTLTRRSAPGPRSQFGSPFGGNSLDSDETASVIVSGTEPEDVRVFEAGDPPVRLLLTEKKPRRLLVDLNGDGVYQPDEIHRSRDGRFRDVRIPYPAREDVPFIDVGFYSFSVFGSSEIYVTGITSVYEGELTIDGTGVRARLIFRDPFPEKDAVNEIVVLETKRDRSFDTRTDTWFSSEGVAYIDGRLRTVNTAFDGNSAQVTLSPYSGPTGKLEIGGGGLLRLAARRLPLENTTDPYKKPFDLCLPGPGDEGYEVPAGVYRPVEVWLRSPRDQDTYYHAEIDETTVEARLAPGSMATLPVGGPLTGDVDVRQSFLSGGVQLSFQGYTNPAGIGFKPRVETPRGMSDPDEGPRFEIRNTEGNVVASGKFDYG